MARYEKSAQLGGVSFRTIGGLRLVLDMMMPQMSGTGVLEAVRKVGSDVAVGVATALRLKMSKPSGEA